MERVLTWLRHTARPAVLGLFLMLAPILAPVLAPEPAYAQTETASEEWVVRQSRYNVDETAQRLEDAIVRSGSVVVAVIDHQAAARAVGQELPPTKVVLFARPKSSTPLMADNRRIAIDLPQRFLVWEEGGETRIGYVAPFSLAQRYGMTGDRPEWEDMRSSLEALAQAASSRAR